MASKRKNIRAIIADPPFVHHTQPQQIPPATAEQSLTKYLTESESHPYMHPDSHLSNAGIRFAIGSGPQGGVALHHIRRIAAGLRGEYLEKETAEELEARFGPAPGDDNLLDGLIDKSEKKLRKKRKRDVEIEEWASSSELAVDPEDVNDQYRGYAYHHHEIESFANTPVHHPDYEEEVQGQDPYFYEQQQRVWTRDPRDGEGGAVGTMVQRNGEVPEVVQHDSLGNVAKSKEERKKAKKRRREQEKWEKIRATEEEKKSKAMKVRVDADEKAEEARKAEKKARKEEKKRKREKEEPELAREDEEDAKRAEKKKRKQEEREKEGRKEKKEKKAKEKG